MAEVNNIGQTNTFQEENIAAGMHVKKILGEDPDRMEFSNSSASAVKEHTHRIAMVDHNLLNS